MHAFYSETVNFPKIFPKTDTKKTQMLNLHQSMYYNTSQVKIQDKRKSDKN